MIPNPKKNITIDFTVAEIKSALTKVPAYFVNKFTLEKRNDMLNMYTFGTLEFLSLGVYVDINLNSLLENKTEIIIEVRRKIGAFDKMIEVQKANKHIETLFNGISVLLGVVRQQNAENSISVDVENPYEVVKYDLRWDAIRRHVKTLAIVHPATYSIDNTDNSNEIILRRKPQSGDEFYLDADAIVKITSEVKYLITNDNNKITTQGELSRNKLILKITINLISKIINDLKTKISVAESELVKINKWKLGRNEKKKQEQIDNQIEIIKDLNRQLSA
jgi:hypothetical protein